MGHAAERARRLIDEDASFADAIVSIRSALEERDEVEWRDVKDDLTSGEWGRLIQEGVLESGEEGFYLADPEGIQELMDEGYEPISVDIPEVDADVSWSTYDKLAGGATVLFMLGYWYDPVRDQLGESINLIVAPLEATMPFFAVILALAMITGLYSTLLQANLMDTEVIGAHQARMQAVQEKRKEAQERGDDAALERIQQEQMEAMGGMLEMFKAQFRPMVWITLLTIPLFLWLWWYVGTGQVPDTEMTVVLPLIAEIRWDDTFIGPMPSWILWYILCSLGFTQLIRKVLNIQTTPTSS